MSPFESPPVAMVGAVYMMMVGCVVCELSVRRGLAPGSGSKARDLNSKKGKPRLEMCRSM